MYFDNILKAIPVNNWIKAFTFNESLGPPFIWGSLLSRRYTCKRFPNSLSNFTFVKRNLEGERNAWVSILETNETTSRPDVWFYAYLSLAFFSRPVNLVFLPISFGLQRSASISSFWKKEQLKRERDEALWSLCHFPQVQSRTGGIPIYSSIYRLYQLEADESSCWRFILYVLLCLSRTRSGRIYIYNIFMRFFSASAVASGWA